MSYTTQIAWEPLRSLDATTLAGSYVNVGTPLENPGYIVKMVNTSDVDVTVSVDGSTDVDICPAGGFWLYDEGKIGLSAGIPALPAGTQLMVNGTGATTGDIFVVVQYIRRL